MPLPNNLSGQQEEHLATISGDFCRELGEKYRRGQAEHGGNLWDRDCLTEAIKETVDLVTYLHTERSNKERVKAQLVWVLQEEVLSFSVRARVKNALMILNGEVAPAITKHEKV